MPKARPDSRTATDNSFGEYVRKQLADTSKQTDDEFETLPNFPLSTDLRTGFSVSRWHIQTRSIEAAYRATPI